MLRNLIFSITLTLFLAGQLANVVAQQPSDSGAQGFNGTKRMFPAPALPQAQKGQSNATKSGWIFLLKNGPLINANEWQLESLEIETSFGNNKIPLASIVAIKIIAADTNKNKKDEVSDNTPAKVVMVERKVAVATNTGEIYVGSASFENFDVAFDWGSGSVEARLVDSIVRNRQGAQVLTAPQTSKSLWTLSPVSLVEREVIIGRNQKSSGNNFSFSRGHNFNQPPASSFGKPTTFGKSAVRPDGKDVFGKSPRTPKPGETLVK